MNNKNSCKKTVKTLDSESNKRKSKYSKIKY